MIDCNLFEFACAPFAGAEWVVEALQAVGLPWEGEPCTAFPEEHGKKHRVSLVRHPCDWLVESFHRIIPPRAVSDFESFVRRRFLSHPGIVGQIFGFCEADSVMRCEDLPWAFVELLEIVGHPAEKIQRCIRIPRSTVDHRWDNRLRIEVLEAEREFCERYDYY